MSLINEALKKAQRDRPQMNPAPPPGGPMPPPQPPGRQPNRKHRGFLWGFLLAVVIVGGVSSLLAAFLVLQLLDPKPAAKPVSPESRLVESADPVPQPAAAPEPKPSSAPEPKPAKEPKPATEPESITGTKPVIEQKTDEPMVAVQDIQEPPADTATPPADSGDPEPDQSSERTDSLAAPAPVPVAEAAVPSGVPPNPEVINRLRNLEIRGVMSGATKVLIYDSSTGKTRVYRAGDPMEDPFGLSIFSISNNSVKFKDYAGHIHTKSF